MKHQEGYFNLDQNRSIYYQSWLPEKPPKAILLVIHGLHEHSSRYQHLAEFFIDNGYGVYALDHVGHGKSSGTRSFVKDFSVFIDPILSLIKTIKESETDVPIYMVGHSLGGLITVNFLIDHQELIHGAVISGTLALVPDYVSDFTINIGRTLSNILPKMRLLALDANGISKDPEVIETYKNDPLVFTGKMTARISNVMNDGIARIAAEGERITKPLLLLHGGSDPLCDPECSKYLHQLISSQVNQLIIYDGLFHEVYNEPEKDQVFNDVLKWLEGLIS